MQPLTPGLLARRILTLRVQTYLEAGGAPHRTEVLVQQIVCDGCGAVLDLRDHRLDRVAGWMTDGDPEQGFKDLCPACC